MSHTLLSALAGKKIVNTRAAHQAAELDDLLQTRGAVPVPYPCIDIVPPPDTAQLDKALMGAAKGDFDWLVLTSVNTVFSLSRRLEALKLPSSNLSRLSIAAIGPATAKAARDRLGLETALLPEEFVAESLLDTFSARPGARVLLPQSEIARATLADGLAAAGMQVTSVVAYQTVIGSGGADVPALLQGRQIDAVTFTSSSTVSNFLRRLEEQGGAGWSPAACLSAICVACIGPMTARTALESGLEVAVVPERHTLKDLVVGLESCFLEADARL
jgi:uroporphyrinogen-III synthase